MADNTIVVTQYFNYLAGVRTWETLFGFAGMVGTH